MKLETLDELKECASLKGYLLGLDYGAKRVGVALVNCTVMMSMPQKSLDNDSNFLRNLQDIARVRMLRAIVIGWPLDKRGCETDGCADVMRFAERVSAHLGVPYFLQDERLTTKAAQALLRGSVRRKERDRLDNSIAAQQILETAMQRVHKCSSTSPLSR